MSSLTFNIQRRLDPTAESVRSGILADPGFGLHMTDHMVTATWTKGEGWHSGQLTAFGPIQISPAAAVLHYAQEIFEGLKAYRHPDGSVWTFRPEANAERLNSSARRMVLPELPVETFIESLRILVEADEAWVPAADQGEKSLYLRPFMYASAAFLGLRPSDEVRYSVIASPAAPIFTGGLRPVTLWISEHFARAGSGGTGAAKCGGNYASALAGQIEGGQNGCDQAVFLDSATHTFVDELGGMNVFFVTKDGRLITPELTGTILPGITRMSVLQLAKEFDLEPEERAIPVQEWKDGVASGDILEVFACGTAAIVTPIGELRWDGGSAPSTAGEHGGPVTNGIRERLLGIQKGTSEDTYGWMHRLV
jgi:branched-chain amino acid aminotransferase